MEAATPQVFELSMPLPSGIDTRIYIHLTVQTHCILLFLTTATSEDVTDPAPLGSFVYALPDAWDSTQALSTPLLAEEPTLDLAARVARLLARKVRVPVHVGNSMSFVGTIMGGSVEEEMATFTQIMAAVVDKIREARARSGQQGEQGDQQAQQAGADYTAAQANGVVSA